MIRKIKKIYEKYICDNRWNQNYIIITKPDLSDTIGIEKH